MKTIIASDIVVATLGIAITVIIFSFLFSCEQRPIERAKTVLDLKQYSDELKDCRVKGKDAGSYAVYEECADGVDRKYGADGGR